MTVANILKGGVLRLSGCNRGGYPSRTRSLLSSRSSISYYASFFPNSVITAAAKGRRGAFFCSDASATPTVSSSCSTTPAMPATPTEANDDSSLSATIPLPSSDPIKDAAGMLDIRVGCILKAWKHAEADSLYVEEVDIGESEPRIICSGLVNYIPLEHLQERKVIVLANLKPRNMRGVKSAGMLLAASDASHENVELLEPPEGSVPGERIWFGSEDEKDNQPDAATPNQVMKRKIWESVQPHLKTDASCVATLGAHSMQTLAGPVTCTSLKNANIS